MLSPNIVNVEKDSKDEMMTRYHDAEYFSMLAHAISGGIESPLQFVLQVLYRKYLENNLDIANCCE